MRTVSSIDILKRIKQENTWWEKPHNTPEFYNRMTPRPYLDLLIPLVAQTKVNRAVVLMGPRRVGKTVMIHHLIDWLLKSGVLPENICYFSVDQPIYNGLSLEEFATFYADNMNRDLSKDECYVFFDEIQYLKEWEKHLKVLTDSYPKIKFLVSGSAAAALKLKSTESGAGRFTDFSLPPLTFHEYLTLIGKNELVQIDEESLGIFKARTNDIKELNRYFINYINFGGYPEVVFSDEIQSAPGRFIKSDIIDKVLLRDLPQLYGIHDIQELNSLFTTLAFNTAGEISLEGLSSNSGVAKNTIKKYMEYFEAAFLIRILHRIDRSARRFKRANYFKVYLTNPSMRAALFSPVGESDPAIGSLVETAIFSQWFHSDISLHYARWKGGEVDIVSLGNNMQPKWAVEVKWSDRYYANPGELKSFIEFCKKHKLKSPIVTTKSMIGNKIIKDINLMFYPSSLYCYTLGYNIVKSKGKLNS